jgi:hypothetical protein
MGQVFDPFPGQGGVGGDHRVHPVLAEQGRHIDDLSGVQVGRDLHRHGHVFPVPVRQGRLAGLDGGQQGVQLVAALAGRAGSWCWGRRC